MYRYCTITFLLLSYSPALWSQLPVCSGNAHVVYYKTQATSTANTAIYNYNIAQPVVLSVNPVLNTIVPPQFSSGLTVSPNLNSSGPSPTFYTTVNGIYYYYNGTTWVSTGHNAGTMTAVNPGAGGGYIYNLDAINGTVWRYNGTGNATQILTLTPLDKVADIAVSCTGEFYIMSNGSTPQTFRKYSSNGTLLNSYTVSGAPALSGGGGLAVFGNTVYYDDGTNLVKGTISGTNINFSIYGAASSPKVEDYANCQSNPDAVQASIDTGYYCGIGAGIQVKAIGNAPFTWKVISGSATITGPGDSVIIKPFTDARIVLLSGTSTVACGGNTDTLSVLNIKPLINAGIDDTIFSCHGTIIPDTLKGRLTNTHAKVIYDIAWTPGTAIISGGNTLSPLIKPLSDTSFTLRVTTPANMGGCVWQDTVNIAVTDATVDALFTHKIKYGCKQDTVLFSNQSATVVGSLQYKWNFDDNGSTGIVKNPTHIYTNQGKHTIELYADNGHCADTATAFIDLDHPLKADFTFDDDLVCEGDTIYFDAGSCLITFKPVVQKYYWMFGNQADSVVSPYFIVDSKQDNKVVLVVTDSLGCTDTMAKNITNILPYPAVEVGPADTVVCDGVPLYLPMGISTNVESYVWQDSSTASQHIATQSGTYIVKVMNRCGSTADTMNITYKNCTVFFPSAFTPNNDGKNDLARLVGNLFGITECDISIYNRFGERVFHTKNKDYGWDGIHKNTLQPLGTYYYYITYKLLDKHYDMKGDITLIR